MTGKLARENASRNPKRTATTASALMIGVALVGFITIFAASAKASVSSAIDSTLKTDYVITGGQGSPTLSPALDQEIAALPVIQASTPLRGNQAKIAGGTQQVVAADPQAASQLSIAKGETLSILSKDLGKWYLARNTAGLQGLVPFNYVKPAQAGQTWGNRHVQTNDGPPIRDGRIHFCQRNRMEEA